ncbi:type II toxin-antitoxin system RelE/ParE family toxin [Oenococcus sp.]|uniref:type II toxin-antitoxin system RelE/ParE family toxin n=1 Tax=Oenococcus sp. TaxID=1979414 RepID=UPI0039EA52B8
MEIDAGSKQMARTLSDHKLVIKKFGLSRGKKIEQRISEFRAATSLDEISCNPPTRLHLLKGDRKGQFSVDVSANYRLLFYAIDKNGNVTVDKDCAVAIKIKEVIDDHGQ